MGKNAAKFSRKKIVTFFVKSIGKYLCSGFCLGSILFEGSHKGHFVLGCLETSMTHLGAGIDKFQLDILQSLPLGMDKEGLKIRKKII